MIGYEKNVYGTWSFLISGSFSNFSLVKNPFYQKEVFLMKRGHNLDPASDFNQIYFLN